jgi:hypothetical protein
VPSPILVPSEYGELIIPTVFDMPIFDNRLEIAPNTYARHESSLFWKKQKQNVGSVNTTEEHLLVCINVNIIGKHSTPEILFICTRTCTKLSLI